MLQNKKRIDEVIAEHDPNSFTVSVRTIADISNNWSGFIPYNEAAIKLIYNSHFVDGVKIKFRYTTLTINARHNLN